MPDIFLFNTLTQKKDKFTPLNPPDVGIYSCGPTVYWNQHIGHMYAYIQWDSLVRFLRFLGYKVKWIMNITDVGHMTSDEDLGEDKMEKGARREGLTVWQVADKYLKQFVDSLALLNIHKPDVLSRATEHIQDQIDLIKKIEERGFTYKTKTGLVFDTSKFKDYAKFARLDLAKQKPGARVEVDPEKKNPHDFLLWVTNQPQHVMQWDSPWGKGFPGWHIECTAMSVKYLGEQFDIHTGGLEHIPVHHTNEIAQAYGAFGEQTAQFWLHNAWLTLKGEKMSKSLGNIYTVQDLVDKDYNPMHFRYLVLTSSYRKGLVFSWEALDAAKSAYQRLIEMMQGWKDAPRKQLSMEKEEKIQAYQDEFVAKLCDDLNFPEALAVLWEVSKSNVPAPDKYDLVRNFDEVLGLKLDQVPSFDQIPDEVKELAKQREVLRKQGKFQEADVLRSKVESQGFKLKDSARRTAILPNDTKNTPT
jgi:cysteinyl-tRNA synthetase